MSAGTEARMDLARLALALSRGDGDGHRWTEEDARQWLLRMGFAAQDEGGGPRGGRGGGGEGGWCDDAGFLGWWSGRKTA